MTAFSRHQLAALILPLVLIPTTALTFTATSEYLGSERGYLLGFLFYWIVWCTIIPISMLGARGVVGLLSEESRLFQRSNLLPAGLLLLIFIVTVVMYPPSGLVSAPLRLLLITIPVATVNGICEEVLWRGVYVKVFPGNPLLSVIYPSIGFALWHLSPQLVLPGEGGVWPLVLSTFFLGISYGWIAYRTRSVRWPAIAHSIGGILSLGGFIAPTIAALL